MTLTKVHIAKTIQDRLHFTNDRSVQLVDSLLEILKKTLENGEDILISGFGKFCMKNKRKRRGKNPHTGEDLMLAPRKVIVFIYSGVLRDKVNGKVLNL